MKTQVLSLLRELHTQAAKALKSKHKTQYRVMEQTGAELVRAHVALDAIQRIRDAECERLVRNHRAGFKVHHFMLETERQITAAINGTHPNSRYEAFSVSKDELYELWDENAAFREELKDLQKELSRAERQSSALQRQLGVNLI